VNQIVTDSTPLEDPKDPQKCNAFAIYKLLASDDQIGEMRKKYLEGGYGFGHVKRDIFELILEKYNTQRTLYSQYMENKGEIDKVLQEGAEKARITAKEVLNRVRVKSGYLAR
jgi:tryptophanyl-tRNA synthetase